MDASSDYISQVDPDSPASPPPAPETSGPLSSLHFHAGRPDQITVDGLTLRVTPREARFMRSLARRPNQVVPPAQLMHDVYGSTIVELAQLHSILSRLRKKFPVTARDLIRNVRGFGFILQDHEHV